MKGVKDVLKSSRTRPPVENADSDATVEIGIARTSRAKHANTGNLDELTFHQANMSNFGPSSSGSSARNYRARTAWFTLCVAACMQQRLLYYSCKCRSRIEEL
jgi:hypothetical protein